MQKNKERIRLGILLLDPSLKRSFYDSGIVNDINKEFEVTLYCTQDLAKGMNQREHNTVVIELDNKTNSFELFYFDLAMHRFKKRSKSFDFREKRNYSVYFLLFENVIGPALRKLSVINENHPRDPFEFFRGEEASTTAKSSLRALIKLSKLIVLILKKQLLRVAILILGSRWLFPMMASLCGMNSVKNKGAMEKIFATQLDLVLVPSHAFKPIEKDIVIAAQSRGIQTFFLIDNWDNLSSKTIMLRKPDFLGTWGPQQTMHALNIQKFDESQLFELGSARYVAYSQETSASLSPKEHPYVLFAGTWLHFDEMKVIQILEEEIEGDKNLYGELRICYRPHPDRLTADVKMIHSRRVFLDPQIDSHIVKKNSGDRQAVLPMDYYPNLIDNCEFLVGGLTSFVLEATLQKKRVLLLAHHEKGNPTSPRRVYHSYTHFEKIEALENMQVCDDLSEIKSIFRKTFLMKSTIPTINNLDYFVNSDTKGYTKRLKEAIYRIIN